MPWQISEGRILYRDILHYYGPFAQVFNALIFKILGVHSRTLMWLGIVGSVGFSLLLYHALRVISDRLTASVGILVFVLMFACSQYTMIGNYNYICPYSHEIVDGVFLSLMTFILAAFLVKRPAAETVLGMGLLLGCVVLTKVEVAVAALAGMGVGGLLLCREGVRRQELLRVGLILIMGLLLPGILFWIYFSLKLGGAEALRVLEYPFLAPFSKTYFSNSFYIQMAGMDDLLGNGMKLLRQCAGWSLFLAWTGGLGVLTQRIKSDHPRRMFSLMGIVLTAAALFMIYPQVAWNDVFRPLPVVVLLYTGFVLGDVLWQLDQRERRRAILKLVGAVFSGVLLLKILWNAHIYHYGFVLALPSVMVCLAFVLYEFPRRCELWIDPWVVRSCLGLGILSLCMGYAAISLQLYVLKEFNVHSLTGSFVTYSSDVSWQGPCLQRAIDYLREHTLQDASVVVVPEGVIINFLSERRNPLKYFEFEPKLIEAIGEAVIVQAFQDKRPDYVVIVERDNTEHGARYFGQDYAQDLYGWIMKNYTQVFQEGAMPLTGRGFGVVILQKKR